VPATATAALLEIDPDLGAMLPPDEFAEASAVLRFHIARVEAGVLDLDAVLDSGSAFAGLIVDGTLLREDAADDRAALQILGAGDVVAASTATRWTAVGPARVGLLDAATLVAIHQWPQIAAGLVLRLTGQLDRSARQLAVCQLPQVEQRLLATMWELASRWGRVSTSGTSLPLQLTHEVLGQLVGAKRPTVSLALAELSTSGALVRRPDRTWLLSGPPPPTISRRGVRRLPAVGRVEFAQALARSTSTGAYLEELRDTVAQLTTELQSRRDRLDRDRARYARTRAASVGIRERSAALRATTTRGAANATRR